MKSLIKYFSLIIALNIFFVITPKSSIAQGTISFQVFYDNLDPYGQWIDYPNYGYVWIPMAGPDFFPYSSNGHWVFTNYGWTWVSNYNWGWAPFHYGRWTYDDYYGWFWIPDNFWGPAWVTWRTSPGYYGWAPLGPNISINIVINNGYNAPPDHWVFVPDQYMGSDDIYTYYGPRKNNQQYIDNSTVINNTYVDNRTQTTYLAGPGKEDVQRVTGSPVKSIEIKENSKPGQSLENNQLNIYRPTVSATTDKNVRPAKIVDKKDVKPISERNVIKQKANEEPIKKTNNKEPLQKTPLTPKTNQEKNLQKQTIPDNKMEKSVPIPQKKQPNVTPQEEKLIPKTNQEEKQRRESAPINRNEQQAPIQQKKEPEAPPPVPIHKDRYEGQKEPNINAPAQPHQQKVSQPTSPKITPRKEEPKRNVVKPIPAIPGKEKKRENSTRPNE